MEVPDLIQSLYKRGHLVEPEAVDYISQNPDQIAPHLDGLDPESTPVITLASIQELLKDVKSFKILYNYLEDFELKGEVQDFHAYFSSRYSKLSRMLRGRPELEGVTSIKNSTSAKREEVSLIGLVNDVSETKSGHYMINLEDQTGEVKVILTKGSEGHQFGQEIVNDEVIGLSGSSGRDVVFANHVTFPGVPHTLWPEQDFSIALLSDTHVGSNNFLEGAFLNFVSWLNGEGPDEQRDIVDSIKYVLIAGDLVDGCGVYKDQKEDLEIQDIEEQYAEFAELISKIPEHITVIVGPGNHDATRLAEPQPPVPSEFAKSLYEVPNLVMVSSPALLELGDLTVLMYHGTSLDSLINFVPNLRKIGYDEPHKAMRTLLIKRHLCPIYGENNQIFCEQEDSMVISRVPNILHMGHVHCIGAAIYRGVRIVNSGTFQAQTPFQAKIGHHPTPGVVPIVRGNGNITMIDFNHE